MTKHEYAAARTAALLTDGPILVTGLKRDIGFAPATPVSEGVARFVAWYREYYRV